MKPKSCKTAGWSSPWFATTFVIYMATSPVLALYAVNTSSCSLACMSPMTQLTTNVSNVACYDTDYNTTTTGVSFRSCVSCELTSQNYDEASGQTDLGWAFYNMRYVLAECLYNTPQNFSVAPKAACIDSCKAVSNSIQLDLAAANMTSTYSFCSDPSFVERAQNCATCYRGIHNQIFLSNYLNTLAVACKAKPAPAITFPVSPAHIFTWNPPMNFSDIRNDTAGNSTGSGGLEPSTRAAIIIIAPVCGFLLITLIVVVVYVHFDTRIPFDKETVISKHSPKYSSDKPYMPEKIFYPDRTYYEEKPYYPERTLQHMERPLHLEQAFGRSNDARTQSSHFSGRRSSADSRRIRRLASNRTSPNFSRKRVKSPYPYPPPAHIRIPESLRTQNSPLIPGSETRGEVASIEQHPAVSGDLESEVAFFDRRVEIPVPHSTPTVTPRTEREEIIPADRHEPMIETPISRAMKYRPLEPSSLQQHPLTRSPNGQDDTGAISQLTPQKYQRSQTPPGTVPRRDEPFDPTTLAPLRLLSGTPFESSSRKSHSVSPPLTSLDGSPPGPPARSMSPFSAAIATRTPTASVVSSHQAIPYNPFPTSFLTPSSATSATFNPPSRPAGLSSSANSFISSSALDATGTSGNDVNAGYETSDLPDTVRIIDSSQNAVIPPTIREGRVAKSSPGTMTVEPCPVVSESPIGKAFNSFHPPSVAATSRAVRPNTSKAQPAPPIPRPRISSPPPPRSMNAPLPAPGTSSSSSFFSRYRNHRHSPPPPLPTPSALPIQPTKSARHTPFPSSSLNTMTPWERISLQAARARHRIQMEQESHPDYRRRLSGLPPTPSISPKTQWPPTDSPDLRPLSGVSIPEQIESASLPVGHRNRTHLKARPANFVESPIVPNFFNGTAEKHPRRENTEVADLKWKGTHIEGEDF